MSSSVLLGNLRGARETHLAAGATAARWLSRRARGGAARTASSRYGDRGRSAADRPAPRVRSGVDRKACPGCPGVGRRWSSGSAGAVPRVLRDGKIGVGSPHAARRAHVRARTAPSSVAGPRPRGLESGRSAAEAAKRERRRHRGSRAGAGGFPRVKARAAVYLRGGGPHTR